MTRIQKDAHIFYVDIEKTKEYYMTRSLCECDRCRNFYAQISGKYPELEAFLSKLGVDITKPNEIGWSDWDDKIDYTPCYTVTGTVERWGQYEIDLDAVVNVVGYCGDDPHARINNEQTEPYFVLVVYNVHLPWVLDEPFPATPKRKTVFGRIRAFFRKKED